MYTTVNEFPNSTPVTGGNIFKNKGILYQSLIITPPFTAGSTEQDSEGFSPNIVI